MATVLIADDLGHERLLLRTILENAGHDVAEAPNGADALALARAKTPDLLITDLLMPEMDGFELCRQWRRDPGLQDVPVLVYSANYSDPDDLAFSTTIGADRAIAKPVTRELVLEAVSALISNGARQAPQLVVNEDFISGYERSVNRKLYEKMAELAAKRRSLEESEARFRAMVEQGLVGVFLVEFNRIVYVNQRLSETFGYEPGEMIGMDPRAMVMPEDLTYAEDKMRSQFELRVPSVGLEFRGRRKDGSAIFVEGESRTIELNGSTMAVGIFADITKKREAENRERDYVERLERVFHQTVELVAAIGELRDPYTHGHERRAADLAAAIAVQLGLDAQTVEGVRIASYLHNIGNVGVPAEILVKPSRLSALEFELVRGHAQAGYEIIKQVDFPWPVADIVRQHHERLDGSGYPQGLKGNDIRLEARILAVADTVEAMSSHRPYRPALGIDRALAEIQNTRGTLYDSVVVDACLVLFRERGYALPS
jgi:PAS domain S-box-containing protein